MELQNQTSEVKRALQEKVLLDDGRLGYVFSELVQIGPSNRWHCHVCSRTVYSERALFMHLSHPLHTTKLRANKHPAKNFKKFANTDDGPGRKNCSSPKSDGVLNSWEMTTDVLPGEPIPPGMEDVVEGVCQIQAKFDEHPGPLIGLEYIVELVTSEEESEPRYICLLCEKKGDPRSLMVHVTSPNHSLKYISCFFRTAGNALNMIPRTVENRKSVAVAIMKVAQEIEKNYGRLKPTSAVAETFSVKKYEILRQIDEKEHFRETPSTTFASLVTPEKINEYSQQEFDYEPSARQKKNLRRPISASNSNEDKPLLKSSNNDKPPLKNSENDKPVVLGDPIEVTSSLSSISPSLDGSDDERKDNHLRRSLSRDRYIRKRQLSPESDERRKFIYSGRRGSPPARHSRGLRSRSRSRDREYHRRVSNEYYRERDRSRRSSSFTRSRGRSRYEDRISEERYRGKSIEQIRYERARTRLRKRYGSRSRDRSRSRGDSRNRGSSRGRTPSRGRDSREKIDRSRSRSRSRSGNRKSFDRKRDIESRWDKYRAELHKLEVSFDTKLKYYEERPEKHPKYSEEWKTFWNKRYKEIQLSGKDPTTYDFKPEWIIFWAKRMKELNEEDFNKERDQLKKKMLVEDKPVRPPSSDLQDISPPTPESQKDVTVDNIKNTWKALTGTEILAPVQKRFNRSPSPWESSSTVSKTSTSAAPTTTAAAGTSVRSSISSRKPYDIAPPVLHCLRMLSVLEHQLGSLGPKVMELLSKALILERSKYNSSMTLLKDVDIHIFFETVKEKIRGQLIAGIVMRNLVSASRAIIKAIESMLSANPATIMDTHTNARATTGPVQPVQIPVPALTPTSEPVQVPGIGMIDKMAVAQQIASALVAQGRSDVTQEELEDLINAVVGIAKASNASVSKNQSSAAFFSQLNIENSTATSHINEILSNMISSAQKSLGIDNKKTETVHPVLDENKTSSIVNPETSVPHASGLVQSNEVNKSTVVQTKDQTSSSSVAKVSSSSSVSLLPTKDVSDEVLKEKLMKFSVLSRDEQQSLIALLKELETSQPARVENLRKYVSIGLVQIATEKNKEANKEVPNKYGGRLSPFSSRVGGANPAPDDSQKAKQKLEMSPERLRNDDDDDDDDDDYSVEEVYKAASEKLFKKSENSKIKNESVYKNSDESNAFGIPSISSNISSRTSRMSPPSSSSSGLSNVSKNVPIRTSSSSIASSTRTSSKSNTCDSGNSVLPMLSGPSPGLLPTPTDMDFRSGSSNIIENMFNKNDPFQINVEKMLGTQHDAGNESFISGAYKNNSRNTDNLDGKNNLNNYYTDLNNAPHKSHDFRDNTNNSAYDYNNRNIPSQQQNFSGYSELKPPPLFEDAQNSRLFNQNWTFGDMDKSQSNFSHQPIGRIAPPQQQHQQGYYGGNSQNNQSAYGGGYRQNF